MYFKISNLLLILPLCLAENTSQKSNLYFYQSIFHTFLSDPLPMICSILSISSRCFLTHWGRVTHICISDLTIIGSDNGLSPGRRQAIIRTNAGVLWIRPLGTNFSESLIEILLFSFKKMRLKVSSAKRRPFCLGLNVLSLGDHTWSVCLTWTNGICE